MDVFNQLMMGFQVAATPINLLWALIGAFVGTIVGVLPGIGPLGSMAILLSFTLNMDATTAMIFFAGIYYGAMYGGSTTSILLNIPGEAASVVTCIDGYKMAQKGRGGAALTISAVGSFVAGTLSIIGLMFAASILADAALKFGPPEFFAIGAVGLLFLVRLSGGSLIKNVIMLLSGPRPLHRRHRPPPRHGRGSPSESASWDRGWISSPSPWGSSGSRRSC